MKLKKNTNCTFIFMLIDSLFQLYICKEFDTLKLMITHQILYVQSKHLIDSFVQSAFALCTHFSLIFSKLYLNVFLRV